MALKITSLIFIISLTFGARSTNQIKGVPFDINEVINRNPTPTPPTGEFLIDTSIAPRNQYNPAIAFDGTNYLIVWEDHRNDTTPAIYGARVDQNGIVLDSCIAISITNVRDAKPSIAFDGTNYLVVWQDQSHIYGARVTTQGLVLDPQGILISTGAFGYWDYQSVAFDGTYFLVVWSLAQYEIHGARVNQQGTVLDTTSIYIAGHGFSVFPSVAFGDTNYFVVWERYVGAPYFKYCIKGTCVSQQGTVSNPEGVTLWDLNVLELWPSITFDGTNFLVVWDHCDREHHFVYCGCVNQQGVVLHPSGINISSADLGNSDGPIGAFNGTNYLIVWKDQLGRIDYDIRGAKVAPSGAVIERFPVSTQSGDQVAPALAHGLGDEFLIVYQGWTDSINHQPVNNYRIWGKFSSDIGIREERSTLNTKRFTPEIYPIPAKGVIRVRYPWSAEEQTHIKIFDVSGKMIKEIEILRFTQNDKAGETKISLKGINPGIYFLRLGKETKKFLVVK